MKGSLVPSLLGRQSVNAGGEELGLVGNRRALCGEDLYAPTRWEIEPANTHSRLTPPLLDACHRFWINFNYPVGFAPDRPGLNQAVENESPIHFRRRRLRHCVTIISSHGAGCCPAAQRLQVWLTSQLGTFLRSFAPSPLPSCCLPFPRLSAPNRISAGRIIDSPSPLAHSLAATGDPEDWIVGNLTGIIFG